MIPSPTEVLNYTQPRERAATATETRTRRAGRRRGHTRADRPVNFPTHGPLAALTRCALSSLRYSARRAGIEVTASSGARGVVSRRESDGRFAFTSIELTMTLSAPPDLSADRLAALRHHTARGCFIGASLISQPTYTWKNAGPATQAAVTP